METYIPREVSPEEEETRRDFGCFHIVVNTNKVYDDLTDDQIKVFGEWFMYIFGIDRKQEFQENFLIRVPFKDRQPQMKEASDQNLQVEFFDMIGSAEVGSKRRMYHVDITVEIVSKRIEQSAVMISRQNIIECFKEVFGYTPRVSVSRINPQSTRVKYYSTKTQRGQNNSIVVRRPRHMR